MRSLRRRRACCAHSTPQKKPPRLTWQPGDAEPGGIQAAAHECGHGALVGPCARPRAHAAQAQAAAALQRRGEHDRSIPAHHRACLAKPRGSCEELLLQPLNVLLIHACDQLVKR